MKEKELRVSPFDKYEGIISKYKDEFIGEINLWNAFSILWYPNTPVKIAVVDNAEDISINRNFINITSIPKSAIKKEYLISQDGDMNEITSSFTDEVEVYERVILTKKAKAQIKSRIMDEYQDDGKEIKIENFTVGQSITSSSLVFIKIDDDTIIAMRYNILFNEDGNIDIKILKYAIISTKTESVAYKRLSKSDEKCTFDEVFASVSGNQSKTSFIDTTEKNPKIIKIDNKEHLAEAISHISAFAKYSGLSIIKNYSLEENAKIFLPKFLLLYSKYPVVEQLLKSGNSTLILSAIMNLKMKRGGTNKLDELIDPSSTTSKKALNMPSWAVEHLSSLDSTMNEFIAWYDIFQLKKNMSKEQFEMLINSEAFKFLRIYYSGVISTSEMGEKSWVLRGLNRTSLMNELAALMPFGYDLNKLIKLIYKQSAVMPAHECIHYLKDMLNMADQMTLEFSEGLLYPQNIKRQHDAMAETFKNVQINISDKKITERAIILERYIPQSKDFPKTQKDMLEEINAYKVVVPHTAKDFLDEANAQRNCVGGYAKAVAEGKTNLFFIRRNDGSSFITAEYKNGQLIQVRTKANGPAPHNSHPASLLMNCYVQNMKKAGFKG